MSANKYLEGVQQLIAKVEDTQLSNIEAAAEIFAETIASGNVVHAFGSGHSVLPVMDLFPRYGAFVGFHPIMDARLMWTNVVGSGGAPEVLWQERQEGYIDIILPAHKIVSGDSFLVFSHGGLNPAPVEMALAAKERGLKLVVVTSGANHKLHSPTHSSGHSLATLGDVVIDNCSPPEDAIIPIDGLLGNVGATSTVTGVVITMALLSETAAKLSARGAMPQRVFMSPNVPGVEKDNTNKVYADYLEQIHFR